MIRNPLEPNSLKSDEPERKINSTGFLNSLLEDHEAIVVHLRESLEGNDSDWKDAGTIDFITDLLEKHEKMAWVLRVHLRQDILSRQSVLT